MRIYLSFLLLLILTSLSAQTYTRGHYIDIAGDRHNGVVAYQMGNNQFLFRESSTADQQKLKPGDVQSFTWGVETFAAVEGNFARVLLGDGPVRLYERRKPIDNPGRKSVVGKNQAGMMAMHRTYILERTETKEVIEVEWKKKKFINQMSAFFADAPELVTRIQNKEFEPGDIEKLLNIYLASYTGQP